MLSSFVVQKYTFYKKCTNNLLKKTEQKLNSFSCIRKSPKISKNPPKVQISDTLPFNYKPRLTTLFSTLRLSCFLFSQEFNKLPRCFTLRNDDFCTFLRFLTCHILHLFEILYKDGQQIIGTTKKIMN